MHNTNSIIYSCICIIIEVHSLLKNSEEIKQALQNYLSHGHEEIKLKTNEILELLL